MPKIVDHDEYRKTLLDQCFELFGQKGYANLSMREIAKSLRVSTGTLYHYFPTKESILEMLFRRIMETNVAEYLEDLAALGSKEKRLERFGEILGRYGTHYQNILLLVLDYLRTPAGKNAGAAFHEATQYALEAMGEHLGFSPDLSRTFFIHMVGVVFCSHAMPGFMRYEDEIPVIRRTLSAIRELPSPSLHQLFSLLEGASLEKREEKPQ
ncbi:TetR/AcrR family transcriptional regulator [Desulfobotulus sp.]|jgi:AcrR family transcriptional regulator|uniref:TetR/AcrR family transcriptional regulator n=1 Tax=Desulfobotulus sp. TaxID=1940337 RepID=UPI002A36E34F|nr:TetR/AcrR family transcriptional regulator [Desulfobotulus sp.]MDY0162701.1 TetR/AcrR family transcriptional regulator [Desulfobotulus sp.]